MRTPAATMGERALTYLAWGFAGLCLLPIGAVLLAALTGPGGTWAHLMETVLPAYASNTALLVLIVGAGSALIGVSTAWLVTTCRFPLSRVLEILLALPLAFPAYVLAYAYTDLLDHPGLVQTWLREVTGWGPRDYWFPEIRSLGGAAAMLTLVLYPYVYLLARAAFLQQSFGGYVAARVLGRGPWGAFLSVSLPMARPAIAGGVLLVVMETIADFGTVAHFGVQTFATGIYQSWFLMADRAAAAQLSVCLLGVALLLAILERIQRGAAKRYSPRTSVDRSRQILRGFHAIGAVIWCLLPVIFGFLLPLLVLGHMALGSEQSLLSSRYFAFMSNSLQLAAIAAVVTMAGAALIGMISRLRRTPATRGMVVLAGIGYAVPGGVIAVGLLVPFAALDNAVDAWMRDSFGIATGLFFTGSILLLILAYTVRFIAAALSAFDTGIASINPNLDHAARTLGKSPAGLLTSVHLPLMRAPILTGLLIVFVDVMKELPATLILRPFNFDTLAVQAHRLAADERLSEAALPSLIIMAFGLIPVILLCRTLARPFQPRARGNEITA